MSTLGSIMLGTTDPDRLHRWYTTALPPDTDSREGDYRILGYGGFYLFIDGRDDVQATHPDPARTLLNFDVEDASGVAGRLDDLGATWVAPLEDRDGSLFATAQDPDGNYLQLIQLSPEHRAAMADQESGTTAVAGLQPSEAFGGFSVDDLDAARAFYGDTLGLEVESSDEPMAMLTLKVGGRPVLVYPKPGHTPASFTILNFPVADVEASVRELTERGITFERYDGMEQDELGIHRGGGPLIAWFTDPAGNVLSVIKPD